MSSKLKAESIFNDVKVKPATAQSRLLTNVIFFHIFTLKGHFFISHRTPCSDWPSLSGRGVLSYSGKAGLVSCA